MPYPVRFLTESRVAVAVLLSGGAVTGLRPPQPAGQAVDIAAATEGR